MPRMICRHVLMPRLACRVDVFPAAPPLMPVVAARAKIEVFDTLRVDADAADLLDARAACCYHAC